MKMIYNVNDRPKFGQVIVFALQQLLAIMAATLAVPVVINGNAANFETPMMTGMDTAAALFGAGVGTIVYLLFTKFRSPVFLGSSFAFIGSMTAAFAGALGNVALGYAGLLIGAAFAGLIYVIIALIVKAVGTNWIDKLMPVVVIGPTVSIIGLSLAGNAVADLQKAPAGGHTLLAVLCGLITLAVVTLCSTYGKKIGRLIPFIIGILAGYAVATIFTVIGNVSGNDALKIIDFSAFKALVADGVNLNTFFHLPKFTFTSAFKGFGSLNAAYIGAIAVAYIPVAFVVFAEHIADHKNISSIIETDLLKDPGLSNTLLGDGVGSVAGAFFGGCPNTTYGESVACVAITRNASVITIATTAILAILIAFLAPFVAFVNTIPSCVMGGVCITLYGFIAVSGLKMIQQVNLNENRNLFVVSTILITGIGNLSLHFGKITLTPVAVALILGILVNLILSRKEKGNTAGE